MPTNSFIGGARLDARPLQLGGLSPPRAGRQLNRPLWNQHAFCVAGQDAAGRGGAGRGGAGRGGAGRGAARRGGAGKGGASLPWAEQRFLHSGAVAQSSPENALRQPATKPVAFGMNEVSQDEN